MKKLGRILSNQQKLFIIVGAFNIGNRVTVNELV